MANSKYYLELIAFYIAYKEATSSERALFVLVEILKQQSSDFFCEVVELFRRYGIKIL